MDGLDREQRELLAAYWWRRTEGELFSARLLRAAYEEAVESVIRPGMEHSGIASAA